MWNGQIVTNRYTPTLLINKYASYCNSLELVWFSARRSLPNPLTGLLNISILFQSVIFDEIDLTDCSTCIAECSVKNVNSSFQVSASKFNYLKLCDNNCQDATLQSDLNRCSLSAWQNTIGNPSLYKHYSSKRQVMINIIIKYVPGFPSPTFLNVQRIVPY